MLLPFQKCDIFRPIGVGVVKDLTLPFGSHAFALPDNIDVPRHSANQHMPSHPHISLLAQLFGLGNGRALLQLGCCVPVCSFQHSRMLSKASMSEAHLCNIRQLCDSWLPRAQAVELAIRLLQMTAAAGHFLQENRLYKSFRLLQRVRDTLPRSSTDDDPKSG